MIFFEFVVFVLWLFLLCDLISCSCLVCCLLLVGVVGYTFGFVFGIIGLCLIFVTFCYSGLIAVLRDLLFFDLYY